MNLREALVKAGLWDESDPRDPSAPGELAAAWQVVERMRGQGWLVRVQEMPDGYPYLHPETAEPVFYAKAVCTLHWVPQNRHPSPAAAWVSGHMFRSETTPHAICLAALAAVGQATGEER